MTDPALLGLLGGSPTQSGVSVTEESALSIGAVWRAVSLIAGTIGALPLEVFEIGTRKKLTVRGLDFIDAGAQTPFEVWETTVVHLLLWGNAYVLKVRDASGRIIRLIPIHPARVTVKIDSDPVLGAVKVFVVADVAGLSFVPYTSFEIMHIPGLNYDGISGLPPVALARESFGVAKAAESMAAKLFGNGALLSGILTTTAQIDQEQSDTLKKRWREKIAGAQHGYDIAILDNGATFQSLTMPMADAQWIEGRTFQVEEIARWFGIPPAMLGEVSKHASQGGGNGMEAQNLGFVQHTLTPWIARIEQRVRSEVLSNPRGQVARFNMAELLRGDMATRYTAYATAVGRPFMAGNEARDAENLAPLPGLDVVAEAANTAGVPTGSKSPSDPTDSSEPAAADAA